MASETFKSRRINNPGVYEDGVGNNEQGACCHGVLVIFVF